MTTDKEGLKLRYGCSTQGNFEICDTISTPHPYCITPRHVEFVAKHCSGLLTKEAIERAERVGARCGVRGCNLPHVEHRPALLVFCAVSNTALKQSTTLQEELSAYLKTCADKATNDGYVGFAFTDKL